MLPLILALLIAQPENGSGEAKRVHKDRCGDALAFQVLLDRRGYSSGEIDGMAGANLKRAITAFQTDQKLVPTGTLDCPTWTALTSGSGQDILVDYRLTADDVKGPFLNRPLPELPEQAALPALSYGSVLEAIAERFHASPRLLARLNNRRPLDAGSVIRVPAVTRFDPSTRPAPDSAASGVTIEVSRRDSTLRAVRNDGSVALFAPVSSGSEHDPLPIGTWKVTGTSWLPPFHYNPDLFWDADPGHSKSVIKPGPNNPVGVVWVDIDVPHYGMHGTPTPNLVGHAQSRGCVRLTNWDAARLASLVKPGTRVVFTE
jgi:lipoprotein-anchoring transpeptidase ErfK/SrfK